MRRDHVRYRAIRRRILWLCPGRALGSQRQSRTQRAIGAALCLLLAAGTVRAASENKHFAYSAAGTFGGTTFLRAFGVPPKQALGVAAFVTLSLGLFKEIAVDPAVSKRDLAADIGGTILGGGLYWVWRF